MVFWQILKPYTTTALENPLVLKILPRYVKVVKNELPAKFQIVKIIPFKQKNKMGVDDLWKEHSKLMEKFYQLQKQIDKGKKRIEDLKIQNLKIKKNSLLDLKILLTKEIMKSCELCERKCGINRLDGKLGNCRVGNRCLISSEFIHMGEEFHISPSHTIFFMGCPFHCRYCQNFEISQWYENGIEVTPKFLAKMIEEKRGGTRNVNFVGGEPTPSLLWILEALKFCRVNIPTLWNSNMYMSEKTMQILDGIVDMYLSDFKYGNNECASRLSKVENFFETCARNHIESAKQSEITLRHLILPNHIECCTKPVLEWISKNIKEKCLVNLMDQYYPCWRASEYPEINRGITKEEFETAVDFAKNLKLNFIS